MGNSYADPCLEDCRSHILVSNMDFPGEIPWERRTGEPESHVGGHKIL